MMASIFALVLLSTLAVPALASEPGSLCVAPAEKPNGRPKNLSNPAGGNQINSYAVCIDDRAPIHVGDKQGSLVTGLDLRQQHLVRIRGDGKEVTAFRFRFADYGSRDLCLWFGPLYETWSLTPAKDRPKTCSCE